ncbi:MAG TPA: hydroxymyristoyl-ACP dehydratase [Ohtaekwangia sp.]|uniref:hydroxymyristoyl-ACP dehydratase n=1 Tax=Ohtaekwangia sp. TaxID=2066019 RepID=UPI002F958C08
MLLDNFYSIVKKEPAASGGNAVIAINASHKILQGHFPGQPVVPGVCMMQIVRELTELFVAKKLRITEGDNLKFLSIIDPRQNNEIDVTLNWKEEGGIYIVNATLFAGAVTFFKFKGTLQAA